MPQPQVRPERTGWRDKIISYRHRLWGWDCPAVDVDFLMLEYDTAEPIALVEYKNEHAGFVKPEHPSYRALRRLADRAGVSLFVARYGSDCSWFRAMPLNRKARVLLPNATRMTEEEWVSFLYKLRGREAPREVLEAIRRARERGVLLPDDLDDLPW
ncbi:MAG: hypothetical protein ACPLRW_06815 [Moorellales bacterium]